MKNYTECYLCERFTNTIRCPSCGQYSCLTCCAFKKYSCSNCYTSFAVHHLIMHYEPDQVIDQTREYIFEQLINDYRKNKDLYIRSATAYRDAIIFNHRLQAKKTMLEHKLKTSVNDNSITKLMWANLDKPIKIKALPPQYGLDFQVRDHGRDLKIYSFIPTVNDKCIFRCIVPDCDGLIYHDQCDTCHVIYCMRCVQLKHNGSCDDDMATTISFIKNNCQSCPSCYSLIHKDSRCSDVICVKCNTSFDWNTLKIKTSHLHYLYPVEQPIDMFIEICGYHLLNNDISDAKYNELIDVLLKEKHYQDIIQECITDFIHQIAIVNSLNQSITISTKVMQVKIRNLIKTYQDMVVVISKHYNKPYDTLCQSMNIN